MVPTVLGTTVLGTTGFLLKIISPRFGKMIQEEAKRKGHLRFLYSRIQTNSEEIAFYSGEKIEMSLILKSYNFLKKHAESIYLQRFWYVIVEQFLMKYIWSAAGLCMVSIPLLMASSAQKALLSANGNIDAATSEKEMSERTENFTMAKNLLISVADAVERILTSYKEVGELTGYTRRVYEMFTIFEECKRDNGSVDNSQMKSLTNSIDINNNDNNDQAKEPMVYESKYQEDIIIDSISVITPNGDLVVPNLSLKVTFLSYKNVFNLDLNLIF
jgi:ABC-type uncharacterized transport system fused permease/ATPase subunit